MTPFRPCLDSPEVKDITRLFLIAYQYIDIIEPTGSPNGSDRTKSRRGPFRPALTEKGDPDD
jgi:hypothetical protein